MCCKLLVLIIFISILLPESICNSDNQVDTDPKCESKQPDCPNHEKSTNIAANAADDAMAAKNALPCAMVQASQRVMNQLADRAEQAARSAEIALNGKKIMIELLEQNARELNSLIDDLNDTLARSICAVQTAEMIEQDLPQLIEQFEKFNENAVLGNPKKLQDTSREDLQLKQAMLREANENLERISKCLQKSQDDLDITEKMSQQADCAAEEAANRCSTIKKVSEQIMRLKKRDLRSFKRALKKILKL